MSNTPFRNTHVHIQSVSLPSSSSNEDISYRLQAATQILRREGIDGFTGGLSAANYITITGTSRATATRDLQELVAMGALTQSGMLKSTRYQLAIA